ncbi:hypothetical protein JCM15765_00480 [Paradesulfitobacterium aromaticivorans]
MAKVGDIIWRKQPEIYRQLMLTYTQRRREPRRMMSAFGRLRASCVQIVILVVAVVLLGK